MEGNILVSDLSHGISYCNHYTDRCNDYQEVNRTLKDATKNFLTTIALATIASVSLTACGDSGNTNNDTAANATGVEAARAAIAPYEKSPTDLGVSSEKLKQRPTGKLVAYMRCGFPICQAMGKGVEEAGGVIGAKVRQYDLGHTPETIGRGWDQMLRDNPAAIIATGVPTALYKAQFKRAAAKKIPVIIWSVPDEGAGITANIYGPAGNAKSGGLMADWVVSHAAGGAKVLYVNVPESSVLKFHQGGFTKELKKQCAGCRLESISIKTADIGRVAPGRIVSYLQRKPDTDWIVVPVGDVLIGVPEAMKSAGIGENVKMLSVAGSKVNYAYIKNGRQLADFASSTDFYGWKAIDTVSRALAGQLNTADLGPIPRQFLTREDLDFDISKPWPSVPGFREQFKTLWGLG